MDYESFKNTIEGLKKLGVAKEDVLDVLEFDSDEYPDMQLLKQVRDEVYGIN